QRTRRLDQPPYKRRVVADDDESRRGRTLLALIPERGLEDRRERLVLIRIFVDDDRVLPPHLADSTLQKPFTRGRSRNGTEDLEANGARARERDRPDVVVADER